MSGEDRRQLVHAAMTLFVVVLRWPPFSDWRFAAALAGTAVLLNWVVMPMLGWDRGLRREGSAWVDGVKLYPVAVLAAVLLFPLPVAAAAWAVLGIGDAMSNVAGRRFGKPPFLGRADRSFAGTVAFVATAFPAALAAHAWVAKASPDGRTVAAAGAAALAGAVVELLVPPRWDDNVAIAGAAGAAFFAVV